MHTIATRNQLLSLVNTSRSRYAIHNLLLLLWIHPLLLLLLLLIISSNSTLILLLLFLLWIKQWRNIITILIMEFLWLIDITRHTDTCCTAIAILLWMQYGILVQWYLLLSPLQPLWSWILLLILAILPNSSCCSCYIPSTIIIAIEFLFAFCRWLLCMCRWCLPGCSLGVCVLCFLQQFQWFPYASHLTVVFLSHSS